MQIIAGMCAADGWYVCVPISSWLASVPGDLQPHEDVARRMLLMANGGVARQTCSCFLFPALLRSPSTYFFVLVGQQAYVSVIKFFGQLA